MFIVGDTPKITFYVKEVIDGREEALDLMPYTITFRVVKIDVSPPMYMDMGNNTATVIDATNGILECAIPSGAFSEKGRYVLHIKFSGNGEIFTVETEPFWVKEAPQ